MKKKRIIIIFISIIILIGIILNIKPSKPKYIFLFIGDGMSTAQVELTEIYENSIKNQDITKQELLNFTKFDVIGIRKNYSKTNYTPDSAASATALASGILTYNGSINTDIDGNEKQPITYKLKQQNKKIGIITTMTLNHATPASFYASAKNRGEYDDIAYDLVNSNFDYFAGGKLQLNTITEEEIKESAKNNGYEIIESVSELNNLDKNKKNIILSPDANEYGFIPFAIDQKTEFNLANYVSKAIEVLDNKNGFFIMAESGLIDTAGHSNDARGVISEVKELERAVEVALEFAKKHPKETLIIVTGDHETGGLVLGNNIKKLNLERLQSQKYSYEKLQEYATKIKSENISYESMISYLSIYYGINNVDLKDLYEKTMDGDKDILRTTVMEIIANEAGISYSSANHTADRIPVYAYGIGSEKFAGIYNTSEFNQILKNITK